MFSLHLSRLCCLLCGPCVAGRMSQTPAHWYRCVLAAITHAPTWQDLCHWQCMQLLRDSRHVPHRCKGRNTEMPLTASTISCSETFQHTKKCTPWIVAGCQGRLGCIQSDFMFLHSCCVGSQMPFTASTISWSSMLQQGTKPISWTAS